MYLSRIAPRRGIFSGYNRIAPRTGCFFG
jgi:hypothetical protein